MDEQANAPKSTTRQAGFTLIELMIVIVIVGMLLTIALPSMSEMIQNQKVKGAANELYFDLAYARSEAIKRNAAVQLALVEGANQTKSWKVSAAGNDLRKQSAIAGIKVAPVGDTTITFNADGRTTAGALSFSFFAPDSVSVPAGFTAGTRLVSMRCVVLTSSGRPAVRIDRNRDGDCTND